MTTEQEYKVMASSMTGTYNAGRFDALLRRVSFETNGVVSNQTDLINWLLDVESANREAYDILDNAFGFADAPYTPAALEAMATLKTPYREQVPTGKGEQ